MRNKKKLLKIHYSKVNSFIIRSSYISVPTPADHQTHSFRIDVKSGITLVAVSSTIFWRPAAVLFTLTARTNLAWNSRNAMSLDVILVPHNLNTFRPFHILATVCPSANEGHLALITFIINDPKICQAHGNDDFSVYALVKLNVGVYWN